jgi:hypothetical protein
MNITVCSAFRSATSYLTRYFAQIAALQRILSDRGDRLHLVLSEGDHSDDTRERLWDIIAHQDVSLDAEVIQFDHHGGDYGSVVNPVRFANMAKVWNRIWSRIPEDADAVLFLESDLLWHPYLICRLLADLEEYPAVAPMVFLRRENWHPQTFYDTWAFRKDGQHISAAPPYFPGWDRELPIRVDSAGSCLAIRAEVARKVTWPAEDVVVGLCQQINELGWSVWLDPNTTVYHL